MKSYLNWLKSNALRVLITAFVLVLVALPFIVVPLMKLRSRVPGLNKVGTAAPAGATATTTPQG